MVLINEKDKSKFMLIFSGPQDQLLSFLNIWMEEFYDQFNFIYLKRTVNTNIFCINRIKYVNE
jgi:hypothetical protein